MEEIRAQSKSYWLRFYHLIHDGLVITGLCFWSLYLFSVFSSNYIMKVEFQPFGIELTNEVFYLEKMKEMLEVKQLAKNQK